jgi:hypothetical protein
VRSSPKTSHGVLLRAAILTTFAYPFLVQLAINLICACLVFPQTLQYNILDKMTNVLKPIRAMVAKQDPMLATDPISDDWLAFASMRKDLAAAGAMRA